jgi:hypothetical protein
VYAASEASIIFQITSAFQAAVVHVGLFAADLDKNIDKNILPLILYFSEAQRDIVRKAGRCSWLENFVGAVLLGRSITEARNIFTLCHSPTWPNAPTYPVKSAISRKEWFILEIEIFSSQVTTVRDLEINDLQFPRVRTPAVGARWTNQGWSHTNGKLPFAPQVAHCQHRVLLASTGRYLKLP